LIISDTIQFPLVRWEHIDYSPLVALVGGGVACVYMWAHSVPLVARSGKHGICESGEVCAATGSKLLG